MYVRDAMNRDVPFVGPTHSLREAAGRMADHNVGAVVVIDPDGEGAGVVTERNILKSLRAGEDPDREIVATHLSAHVIAAEPSWSLERAARVMVHHGWRHIVVCDGGDVAGIVSMRDIVRGWTAHDEAGPLARLDDGGPTPVL